MPGTVDIQLFWWGFWFYIGSFVVFTMYSAFKVRRFGVISVACFVLALAFHTVSLTARWIISTHPPFSTMYEYTLTMS